MTKIGKNASRCNVCQVIVKYNNLKRHVQTKHPDIFEQENSANYIEEDTEEEKDKEEDKYIVVY